MGTLKNTLSKPLGMKAFTKALGAQAQAKGPRSYQTQGPTAMGRDEKKKGGKKSGIKAEGKPKTTKHRNYGAGEDEGRRRVRDSRKAEENMTAEEIKKRRKAGKPAPMRGHYGGGGGGANVGGHGRGGTSSGGQGQGSGNGLGRGY